MLKGAKIVEVRGVKSDTWGDFLHNGWVVVLRRRPRESKEIIGKRNPRFQMWVNEPMHYPRIFDNILEAENAIKIYDRNVPTFPIEDDSLLPPV